jgi:hypothetical protein
MGSNPNLANQMTPDPDLQPCTFNFKKLKIYSRFDEITPVKDVPPACFTATFSPSSEPQDLEDLPDTAHTARERR